MARGRRGYDPERKTETFSEWIQLQPNSVFSIICFLFFMVQTENIVLCSVSPGDFHLIKHKMYLVSCAYSNDKTPVYTAQKEVHLNTLISVVHHTSDNLLDININCVAACNLVAAAAECPCVSRWGQRRIPLCCRGQPCLIQTHTECISRLTHTHTHTHTHTQNFYRYLSAVIYLCLQAGVWRKDVCEELMTLLTEARRSGLSCNQKSIFFSLSPGTGTNICRLKAFSQILSEFSFIQEKSVRTACVSCMRGASYHSLSHEYVRTNFVWWNRLLKALFTET